MSNDWTSRLQRAKDYLRDKYSWTQRCAGTPLENDVPVWLAEFAAYEVAALDAPPSADPPAADDEARAQCPAADEIDGVAVRCIKRAAHDGAHDFRRVWDSPGKVFDKPDDEARARDLLTVIVAMMGAHTPQPATELAVIERMIAALTAARADVAEQAAQLVEFKCQRNASWDIGRIGRDSLAAAIRALGDKDERELLERRGRRLAELVAAHDIDKD